MTEWDFIKEEIDKRETVSLAYEGSIPTWSSKELIIFINNLEKTYESKYKNKEEV